MDWIYLSPHLDDAVLSLGGLIWEQTQAGERVSIWTICAGDPPPGDLSTFAESLHTRWEVGREAIAERRAEDIAACDYLGATHIHFDVPDCIYRRSPKTGGFLYDSEESLWVPVNPAEYQLTKTISKKISENYIENAKLVCPLTVGDHVDHRLVRTAAEKTGIPLHYYAEYPYAAKADLTQFVTKLQSTVTTVSPEGFRAWVNAVTAHRSQISTFWGSIRHMESEFRSFYMQMGGIYIWK